MTFSPHLDDPICGRSRCFLQIGRELSEYCPPTAQPDPNNSSMKKLVYILAATATLLLAKSVEAADKQLEVGISTYALPAAPYVVAQLQPAAPAAEKLNAPASEWRNIR